MRRPTARVLLSMLLLVTGLAVLSGTAAGSTQGNADTYYVQNLESLGGSTSAGIGINNRGFVTGYSYLPGDEVTRATLWLHGLKINLGTLGGPNSSVVWPVKNNSGLVVGISETEELDPNEEAWSCSAFFPGEPTGHVCRGFVWDSGVMSELPTLGGTHGFAAGVNERGQIVGWSENKIHDQTCNAPQVLQFRGTLWGPGEDEIQELPPLGDDTTSAATAINNRGQAVGISGICDNAVGRFSAINAVMWDNGEVIDLGDIGGDAWNTPTAINERGDVVGFANVEPSETGAFAPHAFLWTEQDGIQDLGTLPGDTTSQALGINNRGQVVGMSCGEGGCRAFLWDDGAMIDLNTLVGASYDDHLTFANDIDDRGRITGQAVSASSGDALSFMAIPARGSNGEEDSTE